MKKEQLKKGTKVWCWWRSSLLWYTGCERNGIYVFEDITDAIVEIRESNLGDLVPES